MFFDFWPVFGQHRDSRRIGAISPPSGRRKCGSAVNVQSSALARIEPIPVG
jgi:hypothetical protein